MTRFYVWPFVLVSSAVAAPVYAQIIPDATLGSESSRVTVDATLPGPEPAFTGDRAPRLRHRIDGGAIRSDFLFHSFAEFSIDNGNSAYFSNPDGVANILSRVTGEHYSELLGQLGVLGDANLFLLNPNGIVFGPDASLDVAGSFVATTADQFAFADGQIFSAINPTGAPLLDIQVPFGVQYGAGRSGALINAADLTVDRGENITLIAETAVNTGTLTAPGGEVAIASLSNPNMVHFGSQGQIIEISSPESLPEGLLPTTGREPAPTIPDLLRAVSTPLGLVVTGDGQVAIAISGTAIPTAPGDTLVSGRLDASTLESANLAGATIERQGVNSGTIGGTVQVLGDRVALVDGATLNVSGRLGGGTALVGGDYQGQSGLNSQYTHVGSDARIQADALIRGDGGRTIVWADELTGFYGSISARGGTVSGNGGFAEVSGKRDLVVEGGVDLGASDGLIGTLLLDPENITIVDGAGQANDAQITADGTVLFADTDAGDNNFELSEESLENLAGAADLVLQANANITIQNLSDDALTFAAGTGTITLTANETIRMRSRNDTIVTNGRNLAISAADIALGQIDTDAGNIVLNATRTLRTETGTLRTETINTSGQGGGDGGSVTIRADSNIATGDITTSSNGGQGGDILLTSSTGDITLSGDEYDTRSTNAGNGGDITLNGSLIRLREEASLNATATNGNSGNITLTAASVIKLDNSTINTQPDGGTDNTGNISLEAPTVVLANGSTLLTSTDAIASDDTARISIQNADDIRLRNSEIRTTTTGGRAGAIALEASDSIRLIDTTVMSDATAGEAGQVEITTPILLVRDGAEISSQLSSGSSSAGAIRVNARRLTLAGEDSRLLSQTDGTADGADIITQPDRGDVLSINLRPGASIETSTSGSGQSGDIILGDPNINEDGLAEASLLGNGRVIIAGGRNAGTLEFNARQVNLSPNVTLSANNIFNLEDNLAAENADPSRDVDDDEASVLLIFSENDSVVIEPAITNTCSAQRAGGVRNDAPTDEFVVTGRGGLPSRPNDINLSQSVTTPWVSRDISTAPSLNTSGQPISSRSSEAGSGAIASNSMENPIEVQGWTTHPDGTISLVAIQSSNVIPQSPTSHPQGVCHS